MFPVQITFRGMPTSPAIEESIHQHAYKLARFHDRITWCRVVAEAQHRRHRKGKLWHVAIELSLPGGDLAVTHESHDKHEHEDFHIALRDAFHAMNRRLEDHVRRHREPAPAPKDGEPEP